MGVGDQCHTLVNLPPGKTRYSFYKRMGGYEGWSGRVWKISSPVEFDHRNAHPVMSRYTDWAILAPGKIWLFMGDSHIKRSFAGQQQSC